MGGPGLGEGEGAAHQGCTRCSGTGCAHVLSGPLTLGLTALTQVTAALAHVPSGAGHLPAAETVIKIYPAFPASSLSGLYDSAPSFSGSWELAAPEVTAPAPLSALGQGSWKLGRRRGGGPADEYSISL